MRYYETLYIINPELPDDDYRVVVTKFSDLVGKNKGVLTKVDEWGTKSLAYTVRKFNRGSYVLLQYCGEPGITAELKREMSLDTAELKREMSLDDRIIKYQTIKLSDNADPEALKPDEDEGKAETGEEEVPAKETSAEDEVENGV
ncbi:MAG: 30S ribosomal protein S6 [Deltaproteobacteria bacterium]|nr:30S ribosomal protein S6 [Deltaproteobacteria bacterium]